MTKEQTSGIPEELYNLTQLAEVTLAAGRLSTTNASEIKDYISSRQTPMQQRNKEELESKAEETSAQLAAEGRGGISNRQTAFNSTALYSSSDDDSNYYSHKIFDRKKLRRSTISDNSRFDEHSSCSSSSLSIPGRSGDENLERDCEGSKMHASDSGGSSNGLLDDEHICPECGKKYSTSSNLARHRQTHRSIMDKKARRCPYCEKVYVSMPAFSMHVRTHNQGCECQYCGKCFSRPWLLQGHIRTHTGEKPFKCSVCNKAFADKSNLRAHIQTHSNTKPHSCARCGKAFALKSYLYKHEESSCMKNHTKNEKETRSRRNSSSCTNSQNAAKTPPRATITTNCGDSAKLTLASKLLQKRANPTAIPTPAYPTSATTVQPLNLNSSSSAVNRNVGAFSPNSPPTRHHHLLDNPYATLRHPMSQGDYDHFNRISVIRPPPAVPLAASNGIYRDLLPTQIPMHFYGANVTSEFHDPQETPVDFSPKNNFTHSSKTSPFEMTRNYAIVA